MTAFSLYLFRAVLTSGKVVAADVRDFAMLDEARAHGIALSGRFGGVPVQVRVGGRLIETVQAGSASEG